MIFGPTLLVFNLHTTHLRTNGLGFTSPFTFSSISGLCTLQLCMTLIKITQVKHELVTSGTLLFIPWHSLLTADECSSAPSPIHSYCTWLNLPVVDDISIKVSWVRHFLVISSGLPLILWQFCLIADMQVTCRSHPHLSKSHGQSITQSNSAHSHSYPDTFSFLCLQMSGNWHSLILASTYVGPCSCIFNINLICGSVQHFSMQASVQNFGMTWFISLHSIYMYQAGAHSISSQELTLITFTCHQ